MPSVIELKTLFKSVLQLGWSKKQYKFAIKDWLSLTDLKTCAQVLNMMRWSINIQPIELEWPNAGRIMVLAPHPDDEILGAGGTLIKSIRNRADVMVLYFTSGKESESTLLESETMLVSKRIGYRTKFLRYPNNNIPIEESSLRRLGDELSEFRPDCVFLPALFDDHDDHRRISHLLLEAYRKGFVSDRITIWGYQVYSMLVPNVVVDITAEKELKGDLLRMWTSQTLHRDWAHYILGMNAVNVRMLRTKEARYAEAFFVLPMSEYVGICSVYFDKGAEHVYYLGNYR